MVTSWIPDVARRSDLQRRNHSLSRIVRRGSAKSVIATMLMLKSSPRPSPVVVSDTPMAAATIPMAVLSPSALGIGALFGPSSPGSPAGTASRKFGSSWGKFREATVKLAKQNSFHGGFTHVRKSKAAEFDSCFGGLRLPRTKKKQVARVLRKQVDVLTQEAQGEHRSHTVRKLTKASQERRRQLLVR